jgi:iron complex outermembrane receptor protein
MFNVGIDFAFLKGRLNGTIEYYNKNTTDLIYGYSVSTDRYPVNWINANVGSMNNRGVEFTINAVPVKTRDFMWTSSLNLSHNRNRVTKLSNEQYSVDYINTYNPSLAGFSTTTIQRIIEGQPIGTFYMYEWAGYNENGISQFYAHDEETGERILNEDGTYATTQDPGEKDRTIVGNAQPKLNLGWNNTLTYKNWSLNAFFTGVFGQKIFNELRATYSNVTNVSVGKNVLREVVTEQKATDTMAQAPSDRYLENGSYFRLSSLTLGYTFKNFAGWLNNLHLYATCNNVFTITGYSGRDPEICLGGLTPGCDSRNTQYPRTRQFLFGATINF